MFDDYLSLCLRRWTGVLAPSTMVHRIGVVSNHLFPFFRGTRIREWDDYLLKEFCEQLEVTPIRLPSGRPAPQQSRLSEASKMRILTVLSAMCALAVADGMLRRNPVTTWGRACRARR